MEAQATLPLFQVAPDDPNVAWLIGALRARGDWMTAAELLQAAGKAETESNRRWLRALANASEGEIFSGPGSPGYKLTRDMTAEEYNHYRNATKHQADEMTARIVRTDRVFYARRAV